MSDNNISNHDEPSGDGDYPTLNNTVGSSSPSNGDGFASSSIQPLGPAKRFEIQSPAAYPPPWEDPAHAWRYVGDEVWTGEAFVVSPRTGPDNRVGSANPWAYRSSSVAEASQAPRQTQAPRGLHLPDVFDFMDEQRSPPGLQERETGSMTPPGTLVVFPLTHQFAAFPSPTPRSRDSASQGSSATPRKATKDPLHANKGAFIFIGWNDEAKRELFMWKVKRKKGYAFFLHLFPGETAESLHKAFKQYKEEGERLFNV